MQQGKGGLVLAVFPRVCPLRTLVPQLMRPFQVLCKSVQFRSKSNPFPQSSSNNNQETKEDETNFEMKDFNAKKRILFHQEIQHLQRTLVPQLMRPRSTSYTNQFNSSQKVTPFPQSSSNNKQEKKEEEINFEMKDFNAKK